MFPGPKRFDRRYRPFQKRAGLARKVWPFQRQGIKVQDELPLLAITCGQPYTMEDLAIYTMLARFGSSFVEGVSGKGPLLPEKTL